MLAEGTNNARFAPVLLTLRVWGGYPIQAPLALTLSVRSTKETGPDTFSWPFSWPLDRVF